MSKSYKEYLRWGISHIILVVLLTIANYKVFGFEATVFYLLIEAVSSIMGVRLELIKISENNKGKDD